MAGHGKPFGSAAQWRHDPRVLRRMREVERLHFEGRTADEIAEHVGVSLRMAYRDLEHLAELWKERINKSQEEHRAQIAAELDDVRARTLQTARYSRNPAPHHNVARQASVDKAKVLGVMIEKQEVTGANGAPLFPIEAMRELYQKSKESDGN